MLSPEETAVSFGVDGKDLVESERSQVEAIRTGLSKAEPWPPGPAVLRAGNGWESEPAPGPSPRVACSVLRART